MRVTIDYGDDLSVTLDTDEPGYSGPDPLEDMCARARDLFRLALADFTHRSAEHDRPAE